MTCTGCEALFAIGHMRSDGAGSDGPVLWPFGQPNPFPDDDFDSSVFVELRGEGGASDPVPGSMQISTQNVSSAWYDPVAATGGAAAMQSTSLRQGWQFYRNTPPTDGSREPTDIFVIPLRYRVILVNGVCRDPGGGSSCQTESTCRGLIEIDLEITSSIRRDVLIEGPDVFAAPKTPTSVGVSDPKAEAQNIQISYSSGAGTYRHMGEDPRGGDGYFYEDTVYNYYNTVQEMKVSFFIEPTECNSAASWQSNLSDWLMYFEGYNQLNGLPHSTPDLDFYMSIRCHACYPVILPDEIEKPITGRPSGSQGGGLNENQRSIHR